MSKMRESDCMPGWWDNAGEIWEAFCCFTFMVAAVGGLLFGYAYVVMCMLGWAR